MFSPDIPLGDISDYESVASKSDISLESLTNVSVESVDSAAQTTIASETNERSVSHFIEGIEKVEKDIGTGVTSLLLKAFGKQDNTFGKVAKKGHRSKHKRTKKDGVLKGKRKLVVDEDNNDMGSQDEADTIATPPPKKK